MSVENRKQDMSRHDVFSLCFQVHFLPSTQSSVPTIHPLYSKQFSTALVRSATLQTVLAVEVYHFVTLSLKLEFS